MNTFKTVILLSFIFLTTGCATTIVGGSRTCTKGECTTTFTDIDGITTTTKSTKKFPSKHQRLTESEAKECIAKKKKSFIQQSRANYISIDTYIKQNEQFLPDGEESRAYIDMQNASKNFLAKSKLACEEGSIQEINDEMIINFKDFNKILLNIRDNLRIKIPKINP